MVGNQSREGLCRNDVNLIKMSSRAGRALGRYRVVIDRREVICANLVKKGLFHASEERFGGENLTATVIGSSCPERGPSEGKRNHSNEVSQRS